MEYLKTGFHSCILNLLIKILVLACGFSLGNTQTVLYAPLRSFDAYMAIPPRFRTSITQVWIDSQRATPTQIRFDDRERLSGSDASDPSGCYTQYLLKNLKSSLMEKHQISIENYTFGNDKHQEFSASSIYAMFLHQILLKTLSAGTLPPDLPLAPSYAHFFFYIYFSFLFTETVQAPLEKLNPAQLSLFPHILIRMLRVLFWKLFVFSVIIHRTLYSFMILLLVCSFYLIKR